MTHTDHIEEFTQYLSAYILDRIGKTLFIPPFDAIRELIAEAINDGLDAFRAGASPSGLPYELKVTPDDADKQIVFEQWCVSDIREHIEVDGWTSEDLPTLFKIDDTQLKELLEHCAGRGYSFYSSAEGLIIMLLEDIAASWLADRT